MSKISEKLCTSLAHAAKEVAIRSLKSAILLNIDFVNLFTYFLSFLLLFAIRIKTAIESNV